MKIVINDIQLKKISDVIDIAKRMQGLNHHFDFHTRAFIEMNVFNLELVSNDLKLQCDEFKIIVSDIMPDVKLKFELDEVSSVNII